MAHDSRYLAGIDHFNRRDYYAAHDSWESLWLERFGEEKDFLQGLILCAVALLHYHRGNLNGVRSRFRAAREKFQGYPGTYWDLDLGNFLRRMNGALHRILEEADPPPLRERSVPVLKLKRQEGRTSADIEVDPPGSPG